VSYHRFGATTVEVFHVERNAAQLTPGWYWWACQPGCLPDGDAVGPYGSEVETLGAARDELGDLEDDDSGEDALLIGG
jgi:hypothetical protein